MRHTKWARWAITALALSICLPAVADHHKTVADCTRFEQNDKPDDTLELKLHNSCSIPVDCSLSWTVVCAPKSAKRRATHPASAKLSLATGAEQSTDASASVCGDDAWTIDDITWNCQPNNE
ncbi:MAG TPA: hypothetical protein VGF94_12155 [Kofleriaceae bacterium]|jgi:hypothetical protein